VADVSGATNDILELLIASVPKLVKLDADFGKGLPAVRASSSQVRQIAMNLIVNASDAMDDAGGVIRLSTERVIVGHHSLAASSGRLTEGEYAQVEVTYSRRGKTPMGDRFFDAYGTTKMKGSQGLALAMVQHIVLALGGAIRLSSKTENRTTVQALLPSAELTLRSTGVAIGYPVDPESGSEAGPILIVEDEEGIRNPVTKTLMSEVAGGEDTGDAS
jgi:two-component system cell cycle sensor histidine kinase/response regulator CckA